MPATELEQLGNNGAVAVWSEPHSDDDDTRTAQTVDRMSLHIRDAGADPYIRELAAAMIRSAGGRPAGVVDEVFYWTKQWMTFRDDPPEVELLIEPRLMVRLPEHLRHGDCDDFTMLAGALLEAAGIEWRIVTIKADQAAPDLWSHVYLEALVDGEWIALDTSHGPEPGWTAPRKYGLRSWGRNGGNMSGIGFTTPPAAGTTAGAGGFTWQQALLNTGLNVGQQIGGAFATRISAPAGTFIRQADGSVLARGGAAYPAAATIPSFSTGGVDIMPWLGIGVAGVLLVMVMKR
jgi:hypothetical protein